jgi:uncharacterized protein HemX
MAEPTRTEQAGTDASKPKLKAVDPKPEAGAAPEAPAAPPAPETAPAAEEREKRGSRVLPWLLAALLVVALVWAGLQSQQLQVAEQRSLALSEQVQGLEVQLSAATLQIQSFEMREELVRSVTADLAEQVGRLQELVSPAPPPAVGTDAP